MEADLDLYISFATEIKLVRLVNNVFLPTSLMIHMTVDRGQDATDEDVERALTKSRYWLETLVVDSIAFDGGNNVAIDILISQDGSNKTGNLFLITPDTPSDEVLAAVFQAKINSLANGAIFISSINIESDTMSGLSFTLSGDYSVLLPQTMADWMGEPNYFTVPWWHRNDASTLDVIPSAGADLTILPPWAYSLDFLGKPAVPQEATGDRIIRPDFRPTVINGGKHRKGRGRTKK